MLPIKKTHPEALLFVTTQIKANFHNPMSLNEISVGLTVIGIYFSQFSYIKQLPLTKCTISVWQVECFLALTQIIEIISDTVAQTCNNGPASTLLGNL